VDIVLLGAPGAGKGTQAELLAEWISLPTVSSGVLFREAIEAGTPLGVRAKEYIDRGELVPDQVTVDMIAERLARPDCANGVILDGFPRTVAQAEALEGLLARMGRRLAVVAYLKVSPEVLVQRLSGRWTCANCGAVYHEVLHPEATKGVCDNCGSPLTQREDDTPEVQRRRIQVYTESTAPVIAYYRDKGLLSEVDGDQSVDAVQRDLRSVITAVQSQGGAG
jgi:adenylate kinase